MIYWHVEKHSVCIYSQLKAPSSSEVSSMIEGVLRHDTDMDVEKQYVDTHGQSEVGFAFCYLLGFELLPRLKNLKKQRLYRPQKGAPDKYANFQPILTQPINWEIIEQQYDELIKFATALRLGTADAESILRRFTKNNVQHPTYKALCELGKALKTMFLCGVAPPGSLCLLMSSLRRFWLKFSCKILPVKRWIWCNGDFRNSAPRGPAPSHLRPWLPTGGRNFRSRTERTSVNHRFTVVRSRRTPLPSPPICPQSHITA